MTQTHPSLISDLATVLNGTLRRFEPDATVVLDGVGLDAVRAAGPAVRAAGWKFSDISPATLFYRPDGRTVTVIVRAAVRGNQVGALFPPGADPGVVAMLLDRYHALTGVAWRGAYVTTALAGIRLSWGNVRYQPLWQLPKIGPGYSAGALVWSRDLTTIEREWGYVHTFDTRNAYLGSAINLEAAWSNLHHTGPLQFDIKTPGYWLLDLDPEWLYQVNADPMRPPLFNARSLLRGGAWVTTPYARLVEELGGRFEVLDSFTGRRGLRPDETQIHPAQSRVLRRWGETIRDALAAAEKLPAPMGPLLVAAIKRTYKDATGGMQREGMRVTRPDWSHTLIDLRRATLYRTMMRVHATQGVWPVEIKTDSLSYADCVPMPQTRSMTGTDVSLGEAVGLRKGTGGLRHENTVATTEWLKAHEPKTRKVRR